MNLTKLRNNQIQLIEYMKKGGYSKRYIHEIEIEINRFLNYGEEFDSYLEYYKYYVEPKCNNHTKHDKLSLLTLIMNFDLYDEFPNRKKFQHKIVDYSNYSKLNNYFKHIIDTYSKNAENKGKKKITIDTDAGSCTCFFIYLQNKGHKNLKNIKEKDVLEFFLDQENNCKYSYSYVKKIRLVLKETSFFINEINEFIEYIPKISDSRKNIDYLKQEEIAKIKDVLNNEQSNVCLRDKAIVTLLLYTGLRKCDIVNLKLSNIDWNNETINIVQSKTEIPLELPLTKSVGNALFKYITKERPKLNINNLFIRMDAHYPITKNSVDFAVVNVFKEANIRQNDGERKGTHIFRYNVAISLLKNEIPQPIISQVLGHSTPSSLEHYLNADFYHLKQCSLSIEQFKNIKEVI